MPGKLWENTREWHHKCEGHPVGAAMASGSPPNEWYADWMMTLFIIHNKIDPYMEECTRRTHRLSQDLIDMKILPIIPSCVCDWYPLHLYKNEAMGFAYVLTGAHLMGGEIMRRRLASYPTSHLEWDDRKEALAYLSTLRDQEEYTEGALQCFKLLYQAMVEIEQNRCISTT